MQTGSALKHKHRRGYEAAVVPASSVCFFQVIYNVMTSNMFYDERVNILPNEG